VKILLNNGVGLQRRGGKNYLNGMRAGFVNLHHQKSVSSGKQVNAGINQELLGQLVVPWVQRTYFNGNTSSSRLSAVPYSKDHPAILGGILDFWGLAATFARLELLDFPMQNIFQEKVQATLHDKMDALLPLIAPVWDWFAGEYIRKTCRSFCRHQ
jgi:hypothetical protein